MCALADGQIDGPGHGGGVERAKQGGYDCALACAPERPPAPAPLPPCRPRKVTGSFPADKLKHRLASQDEAQGRAGLLGWWEVCALADGQIDGPGHGGGVENAKQGGYDCALACD